jgi:hypothetical protein
LNWLCEQRVGKYWRRCEEAKRQKSRSLLKRGHWQRIASVSTSESASKAGRPGLGVSEERAAFHQSSTRTYNETKKESRSSMAPSFGESLVQHKVWAPSPYLRITHQTSKKKHITLENHILTDIPPENLAMHYGRAKMSRRA